MATKDYDNIVQPLVTSDRLDDDRERFLFGQEQLAERSISHDRKKELELQTPNPEVIEALRESEV